MTDVRKFDTSISCSRDSHGFINIRISDTRAVNAIIEVRLTLEQFAYLVTGMTTEGQAVARHPERLGFVRETKLRSVSCPLETYDKKELSQWLVDNCQESGWELDTYLGSQASVKYLPPGEGCILNYRIARWNKPGSSLDRHVDN